MVQDHDRFRIEKDSMGEVRVPAEALYGAQTQRAVENFTLAPTPLPWDFIATILEIKAAAAQTNAQLGLLDEKKAEYIKEAVAELLRSRPVEQFPISIFQTGSGTSTNMNVNEVIATKVSKRGLEISPNDHVNLGQSSNDVIPAAIHISSARKMHAHLFGSLEELATVIRRFGNQHREIVKTGRTHLMDAVPIRLQQEFETWASQLDECGERLHSSLTRLLRLPLGGTAIGTGLNSHPDFGARISAILSKHTGLAFSRAPSLAKGIASLDTVVELSGNLKSCAVAVNKIANDLRWMNSGPLTGLGEIRLPALQPGSSIMPAKVNPVIPEAVNMACAQIIGNDTTITVAGLGGSFQLNTMLPVTAANILQSIDLLSGSCRILGEKAISGMEINEETMRENLSRNPILVTALNPIIGYLKAAEIGKIALQENRPVLEVAMEHTELSREELEKLLDPAKLADGNHG